ncbi:MAG: hypothetical protein L3J23_08780 [Flavobacteriaceae bacterium]|nr:hypothetical protein [Flavobacteriaceae bacterium]
MKKLTTILLIFIVLISCGQTNSKEEIISEEKTVSEEEIIKKYVTNGAKKFNYTFQMNEYQKCLDDGLKVDSTIAYLWQQKAMPYFKAKKYEVGMKYLEHNVIYEVYPYQKK